MADSESSVKRFKVGVNIGNEDGTESRYEEGDEVPELTKKQREALKDAIEE